jgi:hypothetical protein
VSPPTVRNNMASPTTVRMSPTTSMLQSQLSQMQKKKEERHNQGPMNSQEVPPPPTPQTLRRTNSCAQPHLRARLGSATPTFNELQFKYSGHGASPVSDRDYQKEARNTVVGELSSYLSNRYEKYNFSSPALEECSKHPRYLVPGKSRVSRRA